jgi:hypothetical protein
MRCLRPAAIVRVIASAGPDKSGELRKAFPGRCPGTQKLGPYECNS